MYEKIRVSSLFRLCFITRGAASSFEYRAPRSVLLIFYFFFMIALDPLSIDAGRPIFTIGTCLRRCGRPSSSSRVVQFLRCRGEGRSRSSDRSIVSVRRTGRSPQKHIFYGRYQYTRACAYAFGRSRRWRRRHQRSNHGNRASSRGRNEKKKLK